jgi:hypothetical protein
LSAVDLRLAAEHQHPVGQVGQILRGGIAAGGRLLEQGQALLLKARGGMLDEQPGGMRTVRTGQRLARPAMLGNDLPHPGGVGLVHGGDDLVPLLDAVIRRQRIPRGLITGGALQQFRAEFLVHADTAANLPAKTPAG